MSWPQASGWPTNGLAAQAQQSGLSASVFDTNLFPAIPTAGVYLVTAVASVTVAAVAGTLTLNIKSNDGVAFTLSSASFTLTGTGRVAMAVPVRTNGAHITYGCVLAGLTGTPTYSIDVQAVRLG